MTSGSGRAAPEQGSWNVPGSAPAYPVDEPPAVTTRRGRPGLVALVVALVELVVVAAACNQGLYRHAVRYLADHPSSFLGRAVGSSLQFTWRVSPAAGDNRGGVHVLYSELTAIAVLVVLTALLSAVAVRGPVTFWRAFWGIWTATTAAACVGRAVGSTVTAPVDPRSDRLTSAIFQSVTGATFFAGLALGLVTALIAALVAVGTRREVAGPVAAVPVATEPAYVPETPPPFYGADNATTALPRVPDHARTTDAVEDGQTTQALPTPPDDDRR